WVGSDNSMGKRFVADLSRALANCPSAQVLHTYTALRHNFESIVVVNSPVNWKPQ
ncbi:hypothetical protein AVEN_208141-1, partial [Araneus ventricosus]